MEDSLWSFDDEVPKPSRHREPSETPSRHREPSKTLDREPSNTPVDHRLHRDIDETRLILAGEYHTGTANARRGLGVAAVLLVGIVAGFAGGFMVGQRGESLDVSAPTGAGTIDEEPLDVPSDANPLGSGSSAVSAGRDAEGAERGSSAANPEGVPTPDSASDLQLTHPASPAASSTTSPAPSETSASTSEPRSRAESVRPESRTGNSPGAPGSIQVLSRPEGAQVSLDGTLVGRTPLVLPEVRPGSHVVRIDLSGHRLWVTTVVVEAEQQARVAASLEP